MASESSDRLSKWNNLWETNATRWHLCEPNPALVQYYEDVTLGRSGLTFLVPLCGKSVDVTWLFNKGHTVIGIEGIEKPVRDFFTEQNLPYEVEKIGAGLLYHTPDKRLRIYCSDLFNISSNIVGQVDCIWDRGSLVAIHKQDRVKYAKLIKSFLKPGFRYLLETVQYDVEVGPNVFPKSVSLEDVQTLFGDFATVKLADINEIEPKNIPQITGASEIFRLRFLLSGKQTN